jgi:hypothetical protein
MMVPGANGVVKTGITQSVGVPCLTSLPTTNEEDAHELSSSVEPSFAAFCMSLGIIRVPTSVFCFMHLASKFRSAKLEVTISFVEMSLLISDADVCVVFVLCFIVL